MLQIEHMHCTRRRKQLIVFADFIFPGFYTIIHRRLWFMLTYFAQYHLYTAFAVFHSGFLLLLNEQRLSAINIEYYQVLSFDYGSQCRCCIACDLHLEWTLTPTQTPTPTRTLTAVIILQTALLLVSQKSRLHASVNSYYDLGVQVSRDLSKSNHVDATVYKANKMVGLLESVQCVARTGNFFYAL